MGFLHDLVHNHNMADPVRGTALVVAVNDWLLETHTPYTLRATLVVRAEGVPKTTVEHSELVNASTGTHLDRWPDRETPSRCRSIARIRRASLSSGTACVESLSCSEKLPPNVRMSESRNSSPRPIPRMPSLPSPHPPWPTRSALDADRPTLPDSSSAGYADDHCPAHPSPSSSRV